MTTVGLLFVVVGAACEPANYPCVQGIQEGNTYRVTLTAEAHPQYIAPEASCNGIADVDTLAVGSVIDVRIPVHAARAGSPVDCYFPVAEIASDVGVVLEPDDSGTRLIGLGGETVFGLAARASVQGCRLEWSFSAFSKNGRPIDVPDRLWVYRQISFAPESGDSAACASAFAAIAASGPCADSWNVDLAKM
jgi:hypothetical protein